MVVFVHKGSFRGRREVKASFLPMSQFTSAYEQNGPPVGSDGSGWGSSSTASASTASGYSGGGYGRGSGPPHRSGGGGRGGPGRGGRGGGGPPRAHRSIDYKAAMAGWEDKCVVGKPRTKDERYNADEFLSSTKWSDKDDDLDLGLKEEVVTAAESAGLEWLSLVQERAIPTLTCKEPMMNAIVQAKSGSGKTAAFVAPILSKIDTALPHPQAIVIVPTYELIDQTREWVDKLGANLEPPVTVALGMKDSADFEMPGMCHAHVVIATPSSFERSIKYRKVDTRLLRMVVVDEADHVFTEKGAAIFSAMKRLLQENPHVQLAFFSATFRGIEKKITALLPPHVSVAKILLKNDEVMVDEIAQLKVDFSRERDFRTAKNEFLLSLLKTRSTGGKVIIFVQSKRVAGDLVDFLQRATIPVSEFSARLDEMDRMQTFRQFQAGKTKTLVSTDVLARGVDVSDVDLVVNYEMPYEAPQGGGGRGGGGYHHQEDVNLEDIDMPEEGHMGPETYVHRIGRTGRFGNFGVAVSFVSRRSDDELLTRIERIYGRGKALIHPASRVEDVEAMAKELHEEIKVKRQKRIDERKAKEEQEAAAQGQQAEAAAGGAPAEQGAGGGGEDGIQT